jgi:hypothetical protein
MWAGIQGYHHPGSICLHAHITNSSIFRASENVGGNWDEYPKIKDHWKSFVEYKKSETFAQKSAQAKNSDSKKREYNHRLGQGGYAVAILLTVNFRQPRVRVIHWFLL